MKSLWIKSLLLTGALTLPSHALIGLGVHLAPAFGPEVKKSSGTIMPEGTDPNKANRILLSTGSVSGMSGLGVKLWIDFIPVVDVEFTGNFQYGQYNMAFLVDTAATGGPKYDTTVVKPGVSAPFIDDKPAYFRTTGDVAILYPFFKIPLVKFSAGGGLSYIVGTPVLNNKFTKKALTEAMEAGGFDPETADADEIKDVLIDAIKDKDNYASGIGFFVQAGAKVKPPIIPLAVYADVKYGFGGPSISGVSGGQGLTLELGGAIAF
jgi:hypothetical protein